MGLLMNTANEVAEKVKDNFNDDENYLFALKITTSRAVCSNSF